MDFFLGNENILQSHSTVGCPSLCIYCAVLSRFSHVQLCATLWTVAHQAPQSTGFSRQEYWSGLLCPSPGNILMCIY